MKKLGIGNAIGTTAFPATGSSDTVESEMLARIDRTEFVITNLGSDSNDIPQTVKTKFEIKKIPTTASGDASS